MSDSPEAKLMQVVKTAVRKAELDFVEHTRARDIAGARRDAFHDMKRTIEDLYFGGKAQ